MTTFTKGSPGAVSCSECRFSPGRHGATCQESGRVIFTLGAWRKCKSFETNQKPCLSEVSPINKALSTESVEIEGKVFSAFCDDCWIVNDSGAETVWTFHDEELAVELFRRYLRDKRAQWIRGLEIERRRSLLRSVNGSQPIFPEDAR